MSGPAEHGDTPAEDNPHPVQLEAPATILERMDDAFFALDDEWRFTYVNEYTTQIADRSADELLGTPIWEAVPELRDTTIETQFREAVGQGEPASFELYIDSLERWIAAKLYPAEDGVSVYFRDVTEQKTREKQLEEHREKIRTLHDVAVDLDSCETAESVCQRTVAAAEEVLEFDSCVMSLERDGYLRTVSMSSQVAPDEPQPIPVGEGLAGTTYERGESKLLSDAHEAPITSDPGPYRGAICVPIGDHGTFQVVSEVVDSFDERDLDLAELLVSHAAEALDRIERERTLNDLLGTSRTLLGVESADAVADVVCESASDALGYDLNAVFWKDADGTRFSPRAVSPGLESLMDTTPSLGASEEGLLSPDGREPRIHDDLRDSTASEGFEPIRSAMTVPLDDAAVLVVGQETPGAFTRSDLSRAGLLATTAGAALDHVRRQQELREYEAIVENARDMLYVLDDEYRFRLVSDRLADFLGYERGQLEGEEVSIVLPDDGAFDRVREEIGRLREGETTSVTHQQQFEDSGGQRHPVETEISLLPSEGQFRGIVGTVRDRSEIVAAQDRAAAEHQRLVALFDQLPVPVLSIGYQDGDALVRAVNPTFADTFDVDVDSVRDKEVLEIVRAEDSQEAMTRGLDQVRNGEKARVEIGHETANRPRTFLVTIVPVDDPRGQLDAYGIYLDVTEREEREKRLEVLQRILRHDIRNSHQIISGDAELLKHHLEDEKLQDLARRIFNESEQIVKTSEKTRELNHTLDQDADREDLEVVSTLQHAIDKIWLQYPDAQIRVDAPESIDALAYSSIETAFEEVIENAIEHNDSDPATVEIDVIPAETAVTIKFSDDGPGMDESERRVFETDQITPLQHSSGIGLWIVDWTVKHSSGDVEISSRTPRGTSVEITLPRP